MSASPSAIRHTQHSYTLPASTGGDRSAHDLACMRKISGGDTHRSTLPAPGEGRCFSVPWDYSKHPSRFTQSSPASSFDSVRCAHCAKEYTVAPAALFAQPFDKPRVTPFDKLSPPDSRSLRSLRSALRRAQPFDKLEDDTFRRIWLRSGLWRALLPSGVSCSVPCGFEGRSRLAARRR